MYTKAQVGQASLGGICSASNAEPAVVGGAGPAEQLDPKSAINQFCQRLCKRPVTKHDIVYNVVRVDGGCQATVKLNCFQQGQEFAGEVRPIPKAAEKSAAQQALLFFAAEVANLPHLTAASKPMGQRKFGAAAPHEVGAVHQRFESNRVVDMAEMSPNQPLKTSSVATSKSTLNDTCMKILRRVLRRGDIAYETQQVANGFLSTVRLPCLLNKLGQQAWSGQVCANRKAAEHCAAAVALVAMNDDPELVEAPKRAARKSKIGGSSEADGAGGVAATDGKQSWPKGKGRGPDLPRVPVTPTPVNGEVLEWKLSHGWIRPHASVEHPMAANRNGKLYVHKQGAAGASPRGARALAE